MIDINLVAERQRERRSRERLARVALFAAMFFFVLTVVAATGMLTKIGGKRGAISKAQADIRTWQDKKAQLDAVKEEIARLEPQVKLLNQARFSELRWCRVLADLHKALPAHVTLTGVRSSDTLRPRVRDVGSKTAGEGGEGLTISGEALQQDLVGLFITKLGQQEGFDQVYLSYTRAQRQADREVYQFELIAMLTPLQGGAAR